MPPIASGLTLEEFEGPRYQRIGHIQMLMSKGLLDSDLRRTGLRLPRRSLEQSMGHTPPNTWKVDGRNSGSIIYDLAAHLYPICRSITGGGVRASLDILSRYIPLTVNELATGTEVFDWKIPPERNIRDAYVTDSRAAR